MTKKLIFIVTWVACVALAVPAGAELLTIIHALPALPEAVPSNNPVDIALDTVCEYTNEPYGAKLGPRQIEPGEHSIIFYESNPRNACRGKVLGAKSFMVHPKDEIDVALGLNRKDRVTVSIWDNSIALRDLERGAETVVEVRHAAGAPELGALLKKRGVVVRAQGLPPGKTPGPIKTTKGRHVLQIERRGNILDKDRGRLKKERVYWVYVTGSIAKNTVEILSIESLPDEAIEGAAPERDPKLSNCCLYGVCSPLGPANCEAAGGIYIGDSPCDPNPCRF